MAHGAQSSTNCGKSKLTKEGSPIWLLVNIPLSGGGGCADVPYTYTYTYSISYTYTRLRRGFETMSCRGEKIGRCRLKQVAALRRS